MIFHPSSSNLESNYHRVKKTTGFIRSQLFFGSDFYRGPLGIHIGKPRPDANHHRRHSRATDRRARLRLV